LRRCKRATKACVNWLLRNREWGSMDLVSFDATDVASFKTNDLSSFHLTDLPFFWMHLMLLALSCVDANARGCRGLCCQLVGSTCTDHADLVCSGGALLVVTTQRIPLFVCAHDIFLGCMSEFSAHFPHVFSAATPAAPQHSGLRRRDFSTKLPWLL